MEDRPFLDKHMSRNYAGSMKRKFPFALVDAFTTRPLSGNPCAIVLEADALTSTEMQAIAKEMNQSETAFLMKSQVSDLRARYFTPEREIPLAGHPTIASIHCALENGLIVPIGNNQQISLELNEGPIKVEIESRSGQTWIKMFQRKPQFFETHDSATICSLFGLSLDDLYPGVLAQTVSTGTRQLMVCLKSHEALKKISMNVETYRSYRSKMNFFSPHFFCLQGVSADAQTFARHPGVPPDTMEDAFTGSATGGMAAYLFHYGLLKKPQFIAEQGHWMNRPGRAHVEVIGPATAIESVTVAGPAVTTIRGVLELD
jgi:trans-2,3-dihydro-3-hydroxyanthranilate isomerase